MITDDICLSESGLEDTDFLKKYLVIRLGIKHMTLVPIYVSK